MAVLPPIPQTSIVGTTLDPVTNRQRFTGFIESDWYQWFLALVTRTDKTSERVLRTRVQTQAASIAPTSLALGTLAPGLYRVTWRFRVTRAATTSSSLLVTLGWTESGLSLTRSSPAKTGNTTTTEDTDSWLIRVDQATAVTYATTYASVGATTMQYEVELVVEVVPL